MKNQRIKDAIEQFLAHKFAVIGCLLLIIMCVCVLVLPSAMQLDPYTSDPLAFGKGPSPNHIFGTDAIGRDLFARYIYGGRTSLFVGLLSVFIAMLIGVPLGLAAGYYRGAVDIVIMRLADVFMSFPAMVLILVLVAIIGPSIWSVAIVIGVMGWTRFARLTYANVLSIREKEYIESARAIGVSDLRIIVRYILANSFSPLLVAATFMTANAIILESSLSFLGMGVQPPQSSWGNMLFDAQSISVLSMKLWQWLPPGLSIVLVVVSINFVGDGIRDALDPKMKV